MTTNSEYQLTHADRCDACGARAYIAVLVHIDKSELLWCAHHGREYEAKLRPKALYWLDESAALNVRLDASA